MGDMVIYIISSIISYVLNVLYFTLPLIIGYYVIEFIWTIFAPTKWCTSNQCLFGKTALITGANSGIGYQTALDFAKRGARVILGCRDWQKGQEAYNNIRKKTDNDNIAVEIIDMASFTSVRNFAKHMNKTERRLDILVNNAGMTFGYNKKTEDGLDEVMQVNYYSHFLLTHLLLDLMKKSGSPGRIINTSSLAAAFVMNFDPDTLLESNNKANLNTYADSKLCQIMFTKMLALGLRGTNITTYSIHPGIIKTEIFRNAQGYARKIINFIVDFFYKPVEEGAQTTVHCSVKKGIEKYSGRHFENCGVVKDYRVAKDVKKMKKLWVATEQIVQLKEEEKLKFPVNEYCGD